MSACFGYLRGLDGDVAGEVRASACEGGGDELEVPKTLEVDGAGEYRLLRGALGG